MPSAVGTLHKAAPPQRQLEELVVTWDITKACNFHCLHCISGAGKKWDKYHTSTDQAKLILNKVAGLGIKEISWSGGEPLFREDLEELMEFGLEKGIETYSTVSNGYFLSREKLKQLRNLHLSGIQISVDGVTRDQNLILRKGPSDSFERAIQAIKTCVDEDFSVVLGTMLYPEMIPTLDEMYDLATELRVEMLRFSGFVPNGRGNQTEMMENMKLSFDEMTTFIRFLRRMNYQNPGFVGLDYSFSLDPFLGIFESSEGISHFFIDYKGDVFPSTGSERPEFKIGNAIEENLSEILSRDGLIHSRPTQSNMHGKCTTCTKFSECGGGPRGISFMFSGDHFSSPELCLYHEYKTRSEFLGDPMWPRMLRNLSKRELNQLFILTQELIDPLQVKDN